MHLVLASSSLCSFIGVWHTQPNIKHCLRLIMARWYFSVATAGIQWLQWLMYECIYFCWTPKTGENAFLFWIVCDNSQMLFWGCFNTQNTPAIVMTLYAHYYHFCLRVFNNAEVFSGVVVRIAACLTLQRHGCTFILLPLFARIAFAVE